MNERIWNQRMLGLTFNVEDGRITIFRSTLDSMSNQTIENRVVSKALQGSSWFRTDGKPCRAYFFAIFSKKFLPLS